MATLLKASGSRKTEFPVNAFLTDRWSPRAMSGEAILKDELMSLLDAARWAPSCYNEQPWRYVYGMKGTPAWNALFSLLVDFNKGWVKNAGALLLVLSRKLSTKNNQTFETHAFDTGASAAYLALQGSAMGLVVHAMAGFDYERARKDFKLAEYINVEAMIAVGKPGEKTVLAPELADREVPSGRKPIAEFAFEGEYKE